MRLSPYPKGNSKMNNVSQNGVKVTQTSDSIVYNGVEYPLPDYVKRSGKNSMSMVNGKVVINGYNFDPNTGKFTKNYTYTFYIVLMLVAAIIYFLFF